MFLSKGAFAMYKPAQSALLDADKAVRIVTLAVANAKYMFDFSSFKSDETCVNNSKPTALLQ